MSFDVKWLRRNLGDHGNWFWEEPCGNRVAGSKWNPRGPSVDGVWALKPYYLGPWTLREGSLGYARSANLHF